MATYSKTYSFLDVVASITGPGGSFALSEGGVANEGITIETNDRVSTVWGADGEWMHSLHAAKGGRVTIRVLRTGKANNDLSRLFAYDMSSSSATGRNILSIRDVQRGDNWTIQGAALMKLPTNTYGTEGGTVEWTFMCGAIDGVFGTGTPGANVE
jgi:hypothetical protein